MGIKGFAAYWNDSLILATGYNGPLSALSAECAANLTRARYSQNCIASDTFKLTFSTSGQDVYVRRNRNYDSTVHPAVGLITGASLDDSITDSWVNHDVTAELLAANYETMINASIFMAESSGDPDTDDHIYDAAQTSTINYLLNGNTGTIASGSINSTSERSIRMHVGKMPETYGGTYKYYIAVFWFMGSGPWTAFLGVKFLDSIPDLTAAGSLWPLTIDNFIASITADSPQVMPWWWTPQLIITLDVTISSGTYTLEVAYNNLPSPISIGTTSAIAFNASAATIQSAIQSVLTAAGDTLGGNILVLGSYPNYTAVFSGNVSQFPLQLLLIPSGGVTVGSVVTGGLPGAQAVPGDDSLTGELTEIYTPFTNGIGGSVTITPVDRPCKPVCSPIPCNLFYATQSTLGAKITIDSIDYQYVSLGASLIAPAWALGASDARSNYAGAAFLVEADHALYSNYPAANFIGGVPLKPIEPGQFTFFTLDFNNRCGTCDWELSVFKQNVDSSPTGAAWWRYSASASDYPTCPPLDISKFTLCDSGTLWGTAPAAPVITITPPPTIPCPSDCSGCNNYQVQFFYRAHGGNPPLVTVTTTRSGCTWTGPTTFTAPDGVSVTVIVTLYFVVVSPYTDCRFWCKIDDGTCQWFWSTAAASGSTCPPPFPGTAWTYEPSLLVGSSSACPPPIGPWFGPLAPVIPACNCTTCESAIAYSGSLTATGPHPTSVTIAGTMTKSGGTSCTYTDDGDGVATPPGGTGTVTIELLTCHATGAMNWTGEIVGAIGGNPIQFATAANTNTMCLTDIGPISISTTDGIGDTVTGEFQFT